MIDENFVLRATEAAWEGFLRPALRTQLAAMARFDGRRPKPGDLLVVFGAGEAMAHALNADVDVVADRGAACVVTGRHLGPYHLFGRHMGEQVAALLADCPPAGLPVVFVGEDDVGLVCLDQVIDLGPDGESTRAPSGAEHDAASVHGETVTFSIYDHPRDFPGKWVVRRWRIGPNTVTPDAAPYAVTDTLAAARAALPPGLVRLERDPADDPVIAETWV